MDKKLLVGDKKRKKDLVVKSKAWKSLEVSDEFFDDLDEGGFLGLEELQNEDINCIHDDDGAYKDAALLKQRKVSTDNSEWNNGTNEVSQNNLINKGDTINGIKAVSSKNKGALHYNCTQADDMEGNDQQKKNSELRDFDTLNHSERKRILRLQYQKQKRVEFLRRRSLMRQNRRAVAKALKVEVGTEATCNETCSLGSSKASYLDCNKELDMDPDLFDYKNVDGNDMSGWKSYLLDPLILKALASLKFLYPTKVQHECLPPAIRDRRDVIGAAETGSGKTLAFGLPILQALMEERRRERQSMKFAESINGNLVNSDCGGDHLIKTNKFLRALIVAPTRELALQVCNHLQQIAKPCGIWVAPIVGGIASVKQERLLMQRPEVIVATPGRLWDLMRDGIHQYLDLTNLSFLVLDEADRMVQQGHFEELSSVIDSIPSLASPLSETLANNIALQNKNVKIRKLQTFVFSATLTIPESMRQRLRKGGGGASGSATLERLMEKISFGVKPKIVDLTNERKVAEKVTESVIECAEDERDERLYYLISQYSGRTLIFANAISMARRLLALFKLLQLPVGALHASMQQRQRLKALSNFENDPNGILIASDVAARGLDIPAVSCVINYQIPASIDTYIHRCGRTARGGREGIAISLVTPQEALRFRALLKVMGREAPSEFPLDYTLLSPIQARVQTAVKLDSLLCKVSKKESNKNWERQAAAAIDVMLDNDIHNGNGALFAHINTDTSGCIREINMLKLKLANLLRQPLVPAFSSKYFTGNASASISAQQEVEDTTSTSHDTKDVISKAVSYVQGVVDANSKFKKKHPLKSLKKIKSANREKIVAEAVDKFLNKKNVNTTVKVEGQQNPKSRFVVIPGSVTRTLKNPHALDAFKKKGL